MTSYLINKINFLEIYYIARDKAITVLGHVTWSCALARARIGGVEQQNLSICTNQSFVNNLFFP